MGQKPPEPIYFCNGTWLSNQYVVVICEQKVSTFMLQSKEYLVKKEFDKIPSALQMITDALSISIHSDNLMKMKAEALLLVCIYGKLVFPTYHIAKFWLLL